MALGKRPHPVASTLVVDPDRVSCSGRPPFACLNHRTATKNATIAQSPVVGLEPPGDETLASQFVKHAVNEATR